MRSRISRWVTGAAVAAVAMVAPLSLVFAQAQERPMRGMRGQRDGAGLARALELTEEQQATWKELREKHRAEMKGQLEQGRALHEALRKAAEGTSPDAAAVGKAFLALRKHQEKAKAGREAHQKELEAILTAEQKTKLEAIKALRPNQAERGGRRGHGGPQQGVGQPNLED